MGCIQPRSRGWKDTVPDQVLDNISNPKATGEMAGDSHIAMQEPSTEVKATRTSLGLDRMNARISESN
jgi:hypothetical protein